MSQTSVMEFKEYFRKNYSHLHFIMSDEDILEFLKREYVKDEVIEKQADLFSDYLLSQDMVEDVQE